MTCRSSFWQPFGTHPHLGIQREISIALAAERRGPTLMVIPGVSRLPAVGSYRQRCCETLRHRLRISLWLVQPQLRPARANGRARHQSTGRFDRRRRRWAAGLQTRVVRFSTHPRRRRWRAVFPVPRQALIHYPYTDPGLAGVAARTRSQRDLARPIMHLTPDPAVQPPATTQKYRIRAMSCG
jgi:hypothetical protein